MGKLIKTSSDKGTLIFQCMTKMALQAQLDRVFNETISCYSSILKDVQDNLDKIESLGVLLIKRLQHYANDMSGKLEACFHKSDISSVVGCIQETELSELNQTSLADKVLPCGAPLGF